MKVHLGKVNAEAKEGIGQKDSVELPVAFVIAGETLLPGDQVTIQNSVANKAIVGNPTGIVDPFLLGSVVEGDRFWLLLNPASVGIIWGEWEHPDFPEMEIANENS